ncbi:VWA domain-containing protein [Clostridium sp. HCS.1]|uniref:VWA domain-containing protein n=1 Tax=Clostridium sp. HCS.1 TaxID=3238594 RepID=UPI003A1013EB
MINKKKVKIISIITTLFVIESLISLRSLNAKANGIASKPSFTITDLKATPNPAKVGEDILVSGKINPLDFETTAQAKEIILVLDVSGSMSDLVTLEQGCAEERERKWVWDIWPFKGHYEEGYCATHKTFGEHNGTSTKIEELKKAAKAFVETMRNVPNLKIGIVKYASDATIVSELKNATDTSLVTSINNLSANGGTNIREGLRKAAFLLNNVNSNANKTVVLMTDGNPTYYSTYDILDNTNPKREGTGSSTNTATMTYTKNLAKDKIGAKQYNAYSIGYGLNSDGTKYLKQIHASMKNLPDNTDIIEKDGFFSKSEGSITEIFNQIAEKIKNSYEIKDVSLDIKLNQSFNLNIGNNKVKVGNIIYNKVSDNTSTGKTRYHADPVSFSFIVKGSQVGQSQSILNSIDINFLFENTNLIEKGSVDVKVDIVTNELPNISATLISENNKEINKDEEITIKYEISPQDFIYNNSNNSNLRDIVFLVDISTRNDTMMAETVKGIYDKIMNTNELKGADTKYSLITFSDNANIVFDFNYSGTKDKGDYVNSINEVYLKSSNLNPIGSQRNIGKALALVPNVLSTSRTTASKNLVIISDKNVTYSETDYNNLKNKNYNIISLSFSEMEKVSNLYKLQGYLGGKDEDIIYTPKNNESKPDTNYFYNNLMNLAKEKLVLLSKPKPYEFKPVINLNIGNNFIPISGVVRSKEVGKENLGIIEVPTIVYNLIGNNTYRAEGKTIEIKLKANNLNPGIYNFGATSDNKMMYKSIINNDVSVNVLTPIFTVKEEVKNLIHGLYNGIIDKEVSIQENDNKAFEIAQGSTVTFGAEFTIGGSSIAFDLNIDSNFNTVNTNNIKVYKVLRDSSGNNTLTEIARTIESNVDNKFKISINNVRENNQLSDTDILVVYQGRVKEGLGSAEVLKNEIKFSNISKDVIIVTPNTTDGSPSLPDLF